MLRTLPRADLASRFSEALSRLDALSGGPDEKWTPEAPPSEIVERFEFQHPCAEAETFLHSLELLAKRLLTRLSSNRGPHALKKLRLTLDRSLALAKRFRVALIMAAMFAAAAGLSLLLPGS